jgi:hypothetical protein
MSLPDPLPERLASRFEPWLIKGIFTYLDLSDVSISRFLQRAAENELRRLAREPRYKKKLEKILNGKYSNSKNAGARK